MSTLFVHRRSFFFVLDHRRYLESGKKKVGKKKNKIYFHRLPSPYHRMRTAIAPGRLSSLPW